MKKADVSPLETKVNNLGRENTEEESPETEKSKLQNTTLNTFDMSFWRCTCGFSSDSYHGLRIHQGRMGCTPVRVRIPVGQYTPPTPPTARPIQLNEPNEPENFIPPPIDHGDPSATNMEGPRQALDFSPGADQVETETMPPTTAVHPREDEEEDQREVEKLRMKAEQDKKRAELQQRIQDRQLKMAEVKSSVFDLKVSLDPKWLEIYNVFSKMMKVVEDARQRSLQPVEERRERVKREGDDLLQGLETEIDELQGTIAELDRNPDLQISPDEPTDWNNTIVDTSFSFGSLRTTTSAMMEQIQLQLEALQMI